MLRSETDIFETCRFCSEVAAHNGEDPAGNAAAVDGWLLFELPPRMWPANAISSGADPAREFAHRLQALHKAELADAGPRLARVLFIAGNPRQPPGSTIRLLHFTRPARFFSEYHKREFRIPASALSVELAESIWAQRDAPSAPVTEVSPEPGRDILICTDGAIDTACGRFGGRLYREFGDRPGVRVWRSNHIGKHRFAPTLMDLPHGTAWAYMDVPRLQMVLDQAGDVRDLRNNFRGWSGLDALEQIADREVWQREGWDWLSRPRTGRIVTDAAAANPGVDQDKVLVELETRGPDARYRVAISPAASVESANSSRKRDETAMTRTLRKQYAARIVEAEEAGVRAGM